MNALVNYEPTQRELEALAPADRWALEEALDDAQFTLRKFNDEELRHWVEVEYKTQAEIAKLVGRTQARISQRCSALGIASGIPSRGGRPRGVISANNPPNGDGPEDDPPKKRRKRKKAEQPDGPAHYLPDVVAEDADENVRTQTLLWFEQGLVVRDLLARRKSLEPRSEEDRKAIKREAVVMERLARRIKEALDA